MSIKKGRLPARGSGSSDYHFNSHREPRHFRAQPDSHQKLMLVGRQICKFSPHNIRVLAEHLSRVIGQAGEPVRGHPTRNSSSPLFSLKIPEPKLQQTPLLVLYRGTSGFLVDK